MKRLITTKWLAGVAALVWAAMLVTGPGCSHNAISALQQTDAHLTNIDGERKAAQSDLTIASGKPTPLLRVVDHSALPELGCAPFCRPEHRHAVCDIRRRCTPPSIAQGGGRASATPGEGWRKRRDVWAARLIIGNLHPPSASNTAAPFK